MAVLRRQDAAGDARRQPRLERAAARWRKPLRRQAERALEVVEAAERLGVVAIGRHHERAAVAVARREARDLLELGGERGPALPRRRGSPAAGPPHRSRPRSPARACPPPRPRCPRTAPRRDPPRAPTGRAGVRAKRRRGRSGLRRSRRRRSVCSAAVRFTFPSRALPRSGSTVGGAAAALSARSARAPVIVATEFRGVASGSRPGGAGGRRSP